MTANKQKYWFTLEKIPRAFRGNRGSHMPPINLPVNEQDAEMFKELVFHSESDTVPKGAFEFWFQDLGGECNGR